MDGYKGGMEIKVGNQTISYHGKHVKEFRKIMKDYHGELEKNTDAFLHMPDKIWKDVSMGVIPKIPSPKYCLGDVVYHVNDVAQFEIDLAWYSKKHKEWYYGQEGGILIGPGDVKTERSYKEEELILVRKK